MRAHVPDGGPGATGPGLAALMAFDAAHRERFAGLRDLPGLRSWRSYLRPDRHARSAAPGLSSSSSIPSFMTSSSHASTSSASLPSHFTTVSSCAIVEGRSPAVVCSQLARHQQHLGDLQG